MPATLSDPPAEAVPAARQRLARLHDTLRSRICLLDYPPGLKLSETALAAEFGVSRTPLRRVLARLEDEGLVRAVQGVGTLVTDLDLAELAQVYRLRKDLALLQVALDPVAPTSELVARVTALGLRAQALKSAPSAREFMLLDRDMFLTLLDTTANAPLQQMSERLYFRTARIWLQQVTASRIDLMQEIEIYVREVADILAALRLGDLDAVGHLRRGHISLSFARLEK
ncbi:GntR family transcriptional regulator [Rhodobacter sp. TJ_12]|uniref:GntR family transcriptional regulator n=1 Tax=Rhodobacter sp. TJ_12 TaxID=2029399 RepID=UPI001CBFF68F|nr:GntR family transcriptional regulator [Rhodobacter sp. TJ_12]